MRVAFLSYDHGEYCIRIASALARDAEVLLLIPRQLAEPHLSRLSPPVDFRPFYKPRLRQAPQQVQAAFWILRQIRKFRPDLIHLQQGHLWFNFVLPLLGRYPLVLTIHDLRAHPGDTDAQQVPQAVYDLGFRRAAQIIVHGEVLKERVLREMRVPEERVHVIPHVLLGEAPEKVARGDETLEVLFFGRIWGYKGLEYLIRAEPAITSAVPGAKIVIAGRGESFDRYRELMVHPDRFEVHYEFVSDEKRAELFSRASIVVLPYIEASQSGVVPVAYTFSKPVVATTVGALPEVVDHGRTGYLVPPRDEVALAEAIIHLLRDSELRHRMGAAGKRKIEMEASPEVVARETLNVYEAALGTDPARVSERVSK